MGERFGRYGFRAALALAAALACTVAASGRREPAVAVVDECASARLPQEILDGASPTPYAPLALVDASAPNARLRLAVADDEASREAGLMCVLRLRPRHGMVFVFSRESDWEFWMKNTLVPLDMVWVRPDGTVTTVAANVPASTRRAPESSLARRRGRGVYVVELRPGEAARDGLAPGARLALPPLRTDR